MATKALEARRAVSTTATDRYERWMAGESAEAIAEADGVSVGTANSSIRQGGQIVAMRNSEELMRLKERAELDNERLRRQVREAVGEQMKEAIATLLRGKRELVVKDAAGNVSFQEYNDPDVLVSGLEQARKTISLDVKPGPSVSITSISQVNNVGSAAEPWDFEGELDRIRAGGDFIDVSVSDGQETDDPINTAVGAVSDDPINPDTTPDCLKF